MQMHCIMRPLTCTEKDHVYQTRLAVSMLSIKELTRQEEVASETVSLDFCCYNCCFYSCCCSGDNFVVQYEENSPYTQHHNFSGISIRTDVVVAGESCLKQC